MNPVRTLFESISASYGYIIFNKDNDMTTKLVEEFKGVNPVRTLCDSFALPKDNVKYRRVNAIKHRLVEEF